MPYLRINPAAVRVSLACMIAAFGIYVSVETIQQHHALETRAFDLGVFESIIWSTVHGRFFWSPLLLESHFAQHSSPILLTLAPIYALVPRPETLLVAQAVLLALAAWPLFLIARRMLGSETQALLVAAMYLVHPAVAGAAFYDFHELAFAPLLFFLAYLFHLEERPVLFWTAIGLLLLVKEDLSLVVVGFGLSCLIAKRRKRGVALVIAGVAAYVLLVHIVIPHFAPPGQSYGWYYGDLVAPGEPPSAVVGAVLADPVKVARFAFEPRKLMYVLKLLGPLCFFPLLSASGAVLLGYGFTMSLLASRLPLFTVGFQYALHVVPYAFVAGLLALVRWWPSPFTRRLGMTRWVVILGWALASAAFCVVFGIIGLRTHFQGGFRRVAFSISPEADDRYREVRDLASHIAQGDSVTASESLVPHVAQRSLLQTLRYAEPGRGAEYDVFFVLKSERAVWAARFPEIFREAQYARVAEGKYTILYRRR